MRRIFVLFITLAAGLMLPAATPAQTVEQSAVQQPAFQVRTAHLIEFNIPAKIDASPGAMVVDTRGEDNNRIWFVTRLGTQRVIRVNPAKSLMKGAAQWTSWELAQDSFTTGGTKKIRASHDRRFVFVRTAMSLQRIDTQNCMPATALTPATCERIEWQDQIPPNVSDLAVDDYNDVFTTGVVGDPLSPNLAQSYVQMLPPGPVPANTATGSATVTRWTVGGGAGFCADLGRTTTSFPCLSGIDTWPGSRSPIYFSQPEGCVDGLGAIAELNTSTNTFRQWCFTTLPADENGPVQQPRQLKVHPSGIVWVVTGSGHLVSLNPRTNEMTKHAIPAGVAADPFGVAPDDDVIGYTDAEVGNPRVAMLLPRRITVVVSPNKIPAPRNDVTVTVFGERANVDSGTVAPQAFVVPANVTSKGDGVFVEALVGGNGGHDSESPLGITPAKWKGQGAFFYAVGLPGDGSDRVGFARLPNAQKVKHPRDDDDTDDGCCSPTPPPGWHNSDVGDTDDDGQGDEIDTPTANEKATIGDPTPLNPGQSVDYPVTASSTTLALLALAAADNPLGQITVEIYNALGALVAGSVTAPGAASSTLMLPAPGSYTVHVKNWGAFAISQTPTIVVKEPWVP